MKGLEAVTGLMTASAFLPGELWLIDMCGDYYIIILTYLYYQKSILIIIRKSLASGGGGN